MARHTFRDLETAAYCPRKLYYRRRDGPPDIPDEIGHVRELAFDYERLLTDDAALLSAPIEPDPATVRERLRAARDQLDCWDELAAPADRDVFLEGERRPWDRTQDHRLAAKFASPVAGLRRLTTRTGRLGASERTTGRGREGACVGA